MHLWGVAKHQHRPSGQDQLPRRRHTGRNVTLGIGAGNGTLQVALTNASGRIIARDDSAPFAWSGDACLITFTFNGVTHLAGYGIRALGLGAGTVWLTPAQAARPVRLRIGAGFAVSGS